MIQPCGVKLRPRIGEQPAPKARHKVARGKRLCEPALGQLLCLMDFDPFRVVTESIAFPGALPPATNCVPFRDKAITFCTSYCLAA